MRLYHGTRPEHASDILIHGVRFAGLSRRDPGDFGTGFYLTSSLERARSYGSNVLGVEVYTEMLARVRNPYFLEGLVPVQPSTEPERLFHQAAFRGSVMLTVQARGEERARACDAVRDTFLRSGYTGIIAYASRGEAEVVLFDDTAIQKIYLLTK